jgi:aminoglycoside N3'-acetyltransferase
MPTPSRSSSAITQKEIETGLRNLGLGKGAAVEVHSSLSSFGNVAGGAPSVIQALINVVGPDGTIVMSAYPVSPAIPLTAEEQARGIIWKVRLLDPDSDEQTGMGAIADAFRKRPDVQCGTQSHRTCAWGRDAHLHTEGYQHLLKIDGWALLIGVDIHRCSSMHVAEGTVGVPPGIRKLFRTPADIQRDYPENVWAIGYGETPSDAWQAVWEEATRLHLVKKQRIGNSECCLFKARAMISIYEEMLRIDPFRLFGVKESG